MEWKLHLFSEGKLHLLSLWTPGSFTLKALAGNTVSPEEVFVKVLGPINGEWDIINLLDLPQMALLKLDILEGQIPILRHTTLQRKNQGL